MATGAFLAKIKLLNSWGRDTADAREAERQAESARQADRRTGMLKHKVTSLKNLRILSFFASLGLKEIKQI